MNPIAFTVPAVPIAQPRQRHRALNIGGRTITQNYTPGKHPVNDFKATVRLTAKAEYQGPPLTGPLALQLIFVMPRPRALVWKTKPMPRLWHESKPDADNLAKAVKDALKGLVWNDDSQVAVLMVRKCIASGTEQPSVAVEIRQVAEGEAA